MKKTNIRKLSIAGIFCAVAVVGSLFSFPVFASKCAPVQHMVNILCAVLLGPWYGVGVAFCASLLRNLLGLGSLMAFPGQYVRRTAVRHHLLQMQKNHAHPAGRGVRHLHPGRTVRLPGCHPADGTKRRRGCLLCLHHPLFGVHRRRSCSVWNFAVHLAAGRRFKEYAGTACPIKGGRYFAFHLSCQSAGKIPAGSQHHQFCRRQWLRRESPACLRRTYVAIMASDPQEAAEITAAADALNINIGTLNHLLVPAMLDAGRTANRLGIPVLLDPVGVRSFLPGAGRTVAATAERAEVDRHPRTLAEIRAIARLEQAQPSGPSAGVDALPDDLVAQKSSLGRRSSLPDSWQKNLAASSSLTGPGQDIVTDGKKAACHLQRTPDDEPHRRSRLPAVRPDRRLFWQPIPIPRWMPPLLPSAPWDCAVSLPLSE